MRFQFPHPTPGHSRGPIAARHPLPQPVGRPPGPWPWPWPSDFLWPWPSLLGPSRGAKKGKSLLREIGYYGFGYGAWAKSYPYEFSQRPVERGDFQSVSSDTQMELLQTTPTYMEQSLLISWDFYWPFRMAEGQSKKKALKAESWTEHPQFHVKHSTYDILFLPTLKLRTILK